jgi:hypothetical protein
VDARRHRQAAAQHARQQLRDLQGLRADHQRPEPPPHDAARPVRVQVRPGQGHRVGGGRTGGRDRQALRHRRHVAGFDQHRGAHHAGHRDESHRWQVQHRRGRRGSGALPQRAEGHRHRRRHQGLRGDRRQGGGGRLHPEGRRQPAQQDQAGRLGPLRRDDRVPGQRRPDPDQDGAGRQARRGRAAARRQGQRLHRHAALQRARRRPDLAAAAPRHLLHRGPGAAHPRPEEREPARRRQRQAGQRGGCRHHRRRRRQVQGRPCGDRRPRRRHGCIALEQHQARRHALGTGPRRDAADPGA